ncbi:MAG TPA: hypothetical protein VMD31_01500 [Opitutaceae bacterium]|nr:hypothetical protein [Opitutaceae bacterium]
MSTAKTQASRRAAINAQKFGQPLHVTLTVTKFVDVLASEAHEGARGTLYDMLVDKHPRAVPGAPVKGKLTTFQIYGGEATICFEVKSKVRGEQFLPVGIAFRRQPHPASGGAPADPLARDTFSYASLHMSGRQLKITDHFRQGGPRIRYKFSVIIQRRHDGALGIIDPDIINES